MSRNFVIVTKKGEQVAQIDTGTFARIMEFNRGEMQLVQSPKGRGVSAYVANQPHAYNFNLGTVDISIAIEEGYRIYRAEDVF